VTTHPDGDAAHASALTVADIQRALHFVAVRNFGKTDAGRSNHRADGACAMLLV
jgi:hypothetical protein